MAVPPPEAPTFDLQSHSTCSDGALPPREVVARAAAAGVELLALSDHDTVEGVDEAIAAGREHGVRIVPAVEISVLDGEHDDLHMLAYCVDHHSPRLLEVLGLCRADRGTRAARMADALEQEGLIVDRTELAARRAAGGAVGRPHLARAVASHPGNAKRLAAEGLARPGDTVMQIADAVLVRYLIPGGAAFRPRAAPTVEGCIEIIHEAGGLAVWAHPFWDLSDPDEVLGAIDRFAAAGLDGVEAFYVTHTPEQTRLIVDHCAGLDLLTTGSADFHGPDHARFHTFRAFGLHGRAPRLGPIGEIPPVRP
ncbi:PHP domain-containing protein [Conexibacter sp. W3-3-2]|uniref:PHP domain-containing protein n=1 Tax=Paraconexibacter algicola TaxID=2133960 RepID=A0A2T4UL06_9ACTN|nr:MULTISPECIES: PHP domain-containing protein [Solirubrobacterales]MTD46268.1 PHP domain-containing protein [Conexibacter sp. W3-3-2]PTL59934.1 PHP domain-containing protein [Paraconexibacter algicola]